MTSSRPMLLFVSFLYTKNHCYLQYHVSNNVEIPKDVFPNQYGPSEKVSGFGECVSVKLGVASLKNQLVVWSQSCQGYRCNQLSLRIPNLTLTQKNLRVRRGVSQKVLVYGAAKPKMHIKPTSSLVSGSPRVPLQSVRSQES